MPGPQEVTLQDALVQFLASLREEKRRQAQDELPRFIRWCGRHRPFGEIQPPDVGQYAERMLASATPDAVERLEQVRAFLTFARRQGFTGQSLAPHVRLRRPAASGQAADQRPASAPVHLTPEGHAQMKEELRALKAQRRAVAQEIQRAAADKDVRENAPLEAARERQGMLEARIRELEATLNAAVLLSGDETPPEQDARRVKLGSQVVVWDVVTGREMTYRMVGPSEANPLEGKLSAESPVGKALLDRREGEEVRVAAPRGVVTYVISVIR